MDNNSPVGRVMEAGLADGLFPGAAASLLHGGQITRRVCVGQLGRDEEGGPWSAVTSETVYDVASLTKPLVGSLLAGMFIEEGLLSLDKPVYTWLTDLSASDHHRSITLRQLLSHSAGYPGWLPLFERHGEGGGPIGRDELLHLAINTPLEAHPGTRAIYSDIGFLVLTALLERVGGARLDQLFAQHVSGPLGLTRTFFSELPIEPYRLPIPRNEIAPTSRCPWRGRMMHGEVEDENAWAAGGIAAHAGLFSTIEDLEKLFLHLRETVQGTHEEILSPQMLHVLWEKQTSPDDTTWALGWDTPNPVGSNPPSGVGERFSRRAVGMWGFTGTSLWYDREHDLGVIFLSNRVHPTRQQPSLKDFRRRFHDAACDEISS